MNYQEYELDYYAEILATHKKIESIEKAREKICTLTLKNDLTIDQAGKKLLTKYKLTDHNEQ